MEQYDSPIKKAVRFLNSWDYAPSDVQIKFVSGGFVDVEIDLGLSFKITIHINSAKDLEEFMICLQQMYENAGMANK